MLGTNGIVLIMDNELLSSNKQLHIVTDWFYRHGDQYAKHEYLEKYVPEGVYIIWINVSGCIRMEDLDNTFRWYNLTQNYMFIDCTKEVSEIWEIRDKLRKKFKQYNINEDHVYWISSNPKDKKYVKHHIYWEMFLTAVKEMIPDRREPYFPQRVWEKKFICYNGRNRTWRRELYDSIKNKRVYTSPKSWRSGLLLQEFNYNFLYDDKEEVMDANHLWDSFEDVNYVHEFWLVTETGNWDVEPEWGQVFLTEKTFKPILLKMGFLIAGMTGSLKKLRNLGFKTFSDYWDESYDDMEDWSKRKDALVETMKDIILDDVHVPDEILEYNYNLLKEHNADQELKDTISNLTPL